MRKPVPYTACARCTGAARTDRGKVQVRVVFGVHPGTRRVWEKKPTYWCSRCRYRMDGHWRYYRET